MCGIAGIYRRQEAADDREVVRSMLETLRSRGPDGEGMVREGRLTLGHRRLAVLDLSERAHQPMASADGRYLISFNGEIYNFRELTRQLGVDPAALRTRCDTEVLLLAWERWGSDCLDRLAGQWAFAMYDRKEERLWLVRDRFGEKPIYHHQQGGVLSFASTIRSLLRVPWVPRELSSDALAEYLTLRYVVSPRTMVSGMSKLPPGHLLVADARGCDVRCWWAPRFRRETEGPFTGSRAEAAEEFGGLLEQATRRCLVSDVPVGLLQSDGIDSGSIRALLDSDNPCVPSFTYEVRGDHGSPAGCGADLPSRSTTGTHTISVTYEEMARSVVAAFSSLNEPVGDGALLATWWLIKSVRPAATVFLCGHGADEVLGGYRLSQDRFRLALLSRACRLPLPILNRAMSHFTNGEEPESVRRARLAHIDAARSPEAARYMIYRPLPSGALAGLIGVGPPTGSYLATIARLYAECPEDASDLDRMQEVLLRTFLPENILCHADSVAMDSSAELRMPFLDKDLVEFVLRLPSSMRVSPLPGRANTKLILRWWARGRLSREVLSRPKRTFRFGSIREILRADGSEIGAMIVESEALRRRLGGLSAWLAHPPELPRGTWGSTTWALLSLAVWCAASGVV